MMDSGSPAGKSKARANCADGPVHTPAHIAVTNRRDLLLGAGSAGLIMTLLVAGSPLAAQEKSNGFEDALKKVLGDAKPTEGKINLDMPEIAENGNTVPFTLTVDSPMTDADYVKAVHVISTGNPQPGVGSFNFTPLSGKAAISSRMRLGRTQDIVAVAALSNGTFLMSRRTVKVTIGGCGG
jgi:sulfur-oxidizing protein SoxY